MKEGTVTRHELNLAVSLLSEVARRHPEVQKEVAAIHRRIGRIEGRLSVPRSFNVPDAEGNNSSFIIHNS
jgi:hypothetical protein